jgi:hypothetical protein
MKILTKANSTKQQRRDQARQQTQPKRKKVVKARKMKSVNSGTQNLMKNAYAMCRLSPFKSMGRSTGIPDGTNCRRLLIDHRMVTTFTVGTSGAFFFAITPAVPAPLWVANTDATLSINGTSYSFNVGAGVALPVCLPEWQNQAISHFNTAGNYDDISALYGAGKFRVVTVGWQLRYLGTTLNDSGLVQVRTSSLTLQEPVPNMSTFEVYSANSSTNLNYSSGQVFVRNLEGSQFTATNFQSSMAYDTLNIPLRQGCSGVLRHSGAEYEYQPLMGSLCYVGSIGNNFISQLLGIANPPTSAYQAGCVQGFDNNWDSTMICVTGATAGQSVMLDMLFCVEYVPQPTSSVYSLAKQGPKDSPGLMRRVEQAAQDLPIASSGLADVLSTAATVGKAVMALM